MGFFDRFRAKHLEDPRVNADISGIAFDSLRDPRLAVFLRGSNNSFAGISVTEDDALKNSAVLRSISLISYSIGMLPSHLINSETKEKADEHPLFRILHREPNAWQTAFDFKLLLQSRALIQGNGYALIVRSGKEVKQLVPLDSNRVLPRQRDDFSVIYEYQPKNGGKQTFDPGEILHLRGLSLDGISGVSLVSQAAQVIALSMAADLAMGRMFSQGTFVNGTLNVPAGTKLSTTGRENLRNTWSERHSGADNAGKTPLLEDGIEYKTVQSTAKDAQTNETRARQVEEIARIFGVPRPLLMVEETSWGSGIDVLGQFFVRYGLNPWFEAWQQAVERTLLTPAEKEKYEFKFNAAALLRGSMAAQGNFFSQALGAGGHAPWMTPNEVRDVMDMPSHIDGDELTNPMTAKAETPNESTQNAQ